MVRRIAQTLGVVCPLVVVVLITAVAGFAQLPTATILGTIKDASGGVVPASKVTARNLETGQTRTTVADADGSYRFSALPVGNYEVRTEMNGFETAVHAGITLTVGQDAVVNFSLQVGAMEQTVSVTGEAPLVNTTSGSLGGLVSEAQVADLPLNGRNYIDLTFLQPGVTIHSRHGDTAGATGTWFSSSGAPTRSNNFLLDGASMITLWGASSASISQTTLGVEGIREFRVITNSYGAEYGMTMGSQTVIVSKSGTNQFHGSLFEYLRNSVLDAANFFDTPKNSGGKRLPPFVRNQFGGSIGGPIRKDKTFFQLTGELLRERLGITTISNVMNQNCHGPAGAVIWNGQGTQPAGSIGPCTQLGPNPSGAGTNSVVVAPVIAPLLSIFPNPNLPNNQLTYPFSQPTDEYYSQGRIDHNFSTSDSIFGRYTFDNADKTTTANYPQRREPRTSRSQFLTLSENHIFSSALLNSFRTSFSRTKLKTDTFSGITGPQYSFITGQEVANITIGGITGFSGDNASPAHHKQNIYTFSDDVFYTRGRHSLKFGTLINRFQQYTEISLNVRANVSFSTLANFMRGIVQTMTVATPGSRQERYYTHSTLGFYGQDDFKLNSRLTLNLGLRYEFATIPQEGSGLGSSLRDPLHDTSTTLGPALFGENPSLHNFSPRVGFAWDVAGNGKTAVRGAFALLYDIDNHFGTSMLTQAGSMPPFSSISSGSNFTITSLPVSVPATKTIRQADYHMTQPHMLQYNLSVQRQLPFQTALTVSYAGSRGINLIGERDANPTIPNGIIQNGACVDRPASQAFDVNAPYCWKGTETRINPAWGYVRFDTTNNNSWYHSLQVSAQKQMSHGLQFQSSYTYSKVIDTTQGIVPADSSGDIDPTDPLNQRTDRARAAFDATHNWRFNTMYQLPKMASGALGAVLNRWSLSSIISMQSGYHFSVMLQRNRSMSQSNDNGPDRPNLVPGIAFHDITRGVSRGCGSGTGAIAAGTRVGTPDLWFDPCAFVIQPAGFLGSAGRNILDGPGLINFDFSAVKEFPLSFWGEGRKLEFRGELFNLFNHPSFSLPNQTAYAGRDSVENPFSTAGRITTTNTKSRQIQFALKLLF